MQFKLLYVLYCSGNVIARSLPLSPRYRSLAIVLLLKQYMHCIFTVSLQCNIACAYTDNPIIGWLRCIVAKCVDKWNARYELCPRMHNFLLKIYLQLLNTNNITIIKCSADQGGDFDPLSLSHSLIKMVTIFMCKSVSCLYKINYSKWTSLVCSSVLCLFHFRLLNFSTYKNKQICNCSFSCLDLRLGIHLPFYFKECKQDFSKCISFKLRLKKHERWTL